MDKSQVSERVVAHRFFRGNDQLRNHARDEAWCLNVKKRAKMGAKIGRLMKNKLALKSLASNHNYWRTGTQNSL